MRCFEDENVIHVAGKVSPIDDIEVINTELALADLGIEKALTRYSKAAKSGNDKEAAKLVAVLEKCARNSTRARPCAAELSDDEEALIKPFCLITAKPAMYVANVKDDGFENNPHLDAVRKYAESENAPVVAVCAAIEAEIADLDDADKEAFLADMGMEEPGLDRVIRAGFKLLGLNVLHRGREGSARVDDPYRRHGAAGGRRDPHRLRARLHPRADDRVRRFRHVQG